MTIEEMMEEMEIIHSRFNFIMAIDDLMICLNDSSVKDQTLASLGSLMTWISEDALIHLRKIHNHLLSSGGIV